LPKIEAERSKENTKKNISLKNYFYTQTKKTIYNIQYNIIR